MLVSATSIKACPDTEGDLWIPVGAGGVYYLDSSTGTLAPTSQDVTLCDAIGIGKAEKDGDYMALYMSGRGKRRRLRNLPVHRQGRNMEANQ